MSFKPSACLLLALLLLGCGSPKIEPVAVLNAAASGDAETLRKYIAAKADLNGTNESGATPLISAIAMGHTETAKILIEAGAKLDVQDNEGSTAVHTAAFFCHGEILKALLAKGADKNIRNRQGATALDSVSAPFEEVQPVYDFLRAVLEPIGLELDYGHLKAERPKMAELLK